MNVFLTGANGFIGGAVGSRLISAGHRVRGRVGDGSKARQVGAHGIEPVTGARDDTAQLKVEAEAADAVVNAASSDHRGTIEALLAGLSGSGKPLLHTSGSSIIGDEAMGDSSDRVFQEDTPIEPEPDKVARVAI